MNIVDKPSYKRRKMNGAVLKNQDVAPNEMTTLPKSSSTKVDIRNYFTSSTKSPNSSVECISNGACETGLNKRISEKRSNAKTSCSLEYSESQTPTDVSEATEERCNGDNCNVLDKEEEPPTKQPKICSNIEQDVLEQQQCRRVMIFGRIFCPQGFGNC